MTQPPITSSSPLATVRSAAFYGLAMLWTLLLAVPYLGLFLLPRRYLQNCGAFYCSGLLAILRLTTGLGHQVRGRANLPPPPFMLAAKHQSAWETLALPTIVSRPSFVLKRSLYKIPVFGWYLKAAGMIGIDRRAGASALRRMIREGRQAAAEDRPIVIFPEGTRTAPGESRPFHVGITALYDGLAIPVVPVALNSGVYWPKDALAKRPGRIVLEILPPIPPGLPRAEFNRRLHDAINDQSNRLVAEAMNPDRRDI
ncbi:MAG: lysophospholipid acyltransferase family protein [Alphaproteobacteria bacterium]